MRLTLFATALALIGSCGLAEAQSSRQAVSRCRPQSSDDLAGLYFHGWMMANVNIDLTRAITVVCPSLDTSVQPDGQVTEIVVSVQDWSEVDGFSVRACRTDRDGADHACSAWVSSGNGFIGFKELTLSPGSVWSTNGFGFLEVRIPPCYDNLCSLWFGWVARQ